MSLKNLSLVALLICWVPQWLLAQHRQASKVYTRQQMEVFQPNDPLTTPANFFERHAHLMGVDAHSTFELERRLEGKGGWVHHHFRQVYKSVPVLGSRYSLHQKAGRLINATGYYLPYLEVDVEPNIDPDRALAIAMQHLGAQTYLWELPAKGPFAASYKQPVPKLYIMDTAYPAVSEHYSLVYEIDLYSAEPYDRQRLLVDAHHGYVIQQLPLLCGHAVPATGDTHYYGEREFIVDSVAAHEYHLHDPTRGGGIFTYSGSDDNLVKHEDTHWDLTNEHHHEAAIDAHFCASAFYDYLLDQFDWNGLGNQGEAMHAVVNGGDFVNAFWNGDYALFGDGNCNNGPLTTLDVVAHEFTHGLTDYTSNLVYAGESGAINESMSDVFGKALEFYIDPDHFTWIIGHTFLETDFAVPFRSFENPNEFEHPKTYKGDFWFDESGVHTNSSVGNHWFYSLVTGGSGVNEHGETYTINPLTIAQAMQIVFTVQSTYLTPSSNYSFYAKSAILAAEAHFGEGAPEVESVRQAWKKVGLPYASTEPIIDLAVAFEGFFVNTCMADEFYTLRFAVTNTGGLPYTPDLEGTFRLSSAAASEDLIQMIDLEILPGQTVTYTIDDFLWIDENNTVFANVRVDVFNDAVFGNDSDNIYIINSLYPDHELELLSASIVEPNCFDHLRTFSFRIRNNSCNTLPTGAAISVQMSHELGALEWSDDFVIPHDLAPRATYTVVATLDVPPHLGEVLSVDLIYEPDNDLTNNDRVISLHPVKSVLSAPYTMDFSPSSTLNDDILRFFGELPLKEYEGEFYFATSSFFPDAQANLCADPLENFNSFARETMTICAQFTGAYMLDFDLIQFRNPESSSSPELSDFTTMVHLSWEDINTGIREDQLIYGQVEGEIVHHQFALPQDFQGQLLFEFVNVSGTFDDATYFDFDVNLLDNLTFTEEVVSTQDVSAKTPLVVHPNPSKGQLSLQHPAVPLGLQIRNLQGQIIVELGADANLNQLDLSDLPNGYYLLSVDYPDGLQYTEAVVKAQ
ncbi:MAG: M4 family metallopeptidase [Bacteroidota bacterium]